MPTEKWTTQSTRPCFCPANRHTCDVSVAAGGTMAPMTRPLSEKTLSQLNSCDCREDDCDKCEMARRLRKLDEALAGKRYGVMLINVDELRRILEGRGVMPKLDPDWKPRDERDARIEELEEELDSYMRATENLAHKLSTAEAEVERLTKQLVAREDEVRGLSVEVERSHKAILALEGE